MGGGGFGLNISQPDSSSFFDGKTINTGGNTVNAKPSIGAAEIALVAIAVAAVLWVLRGSK